MFVSVGLYKLKDFGFNDHLNFLLDVCFLVLISIYSMFFIFLFFIVYFSTSSTECLVNLLLVNFLMFTFRVKHFL